MPNTNNDVIIVPSGVQITKADATAITKQARNETLVKLAAVTGVAALVGLATGYLKIVRNGREVD